MFPDCVTALGQRRRNSNTGLIRGHGTRRLAGSSVDVKLHTSDGHIQMNGSMFAAERGFLVVVQGLEHGGGTAAAHVMPVDGNVLAGCFVVSTPQREQTADDAFLAGEGVIQICTQLSGRESSKLIKPLAFSVRFLFFR